MRTGPRVRAFGLCLIVASVVALLLPVIKAQGHERVPPRDVSARIRTDATEGHASVSGQVRTPDDRPLRGALVALGPAEGEALGITTDRDGRYRFDNLPAGRYTLYASKPSYVTQGFGSARPGASSRIIELGNDTNLDALDIVVSPGCVLSGRVVDAAGDPMDGVSIRVAEYGFLYGRRRLIVTLGGSNAFLSLNDLGEFRRYGLPPGEYYLSARPWRVAPADSDSGGALSYTTTYYPGTANPALATRLSCSPGREFANLDFPLVRGRGFKVEGTVRDSRGKPAANAVLTIETAEGPSNGFSTMAGVDSDGRFSFLGVIPGEYRIRTTQNNWSSESLLRPLTVTGDVTGLQLVTGTAGRIAGKVVPDEGLTFDFSPSQVTVDTVPAGIDQLLSYPSSSVKADWTFELTNVDQPVVLRCRALRKWRVKAIRIAGTDIQQSLNPLQGQTISGVEIVLTNRSAAITGSVHDDRGQRVDDYVVVAFADNPAKRSWTSDLSGTTRCDLKGRFTLEGLAPGVYRVVAVPFLRWPSEATDPEWIARVAARATRVTVTEGDRVTQDLRLVNPADERREGGRP